jgi:hypothetical protein
MMGGGVVSYGMDGWGMGDGIYIGIQYRNRNLKFCILSISASYLSIYLTHFAFYLSIYEMTPISIHLSYLYMNRIELRIISYHITK